MSLADPNDDYSELVPAGGGRAKKFITKSRFFILFLLIGLLIGAYVQYAYINPVFFASQLNSCSDCTKTKELLSKENNCLYSLLQDPQSASRQCSQNAASSHIQVPENLPNATPQSQDGNQANLISVKDSCVAECNAAKESDFDFNTGDCFAPLADKSICFGQNFDPTGAISRPLCANPPNDGESHIIVGLDENCSVLSASVESSYSN